MENQLNQFTGSKCSYAPIECLEPMRDETSVPSGDAVDDTDRLLLRSLVLDGRQSNRDLAAATGVSPATVNRRLRRLGDGGVLRGVSALVDAESVGWGLTVIVGLRIEKGHLERVQRAIAEDARVFAVYDVTGEWDGMVLARCRDRRDLDDLAKTTLSSPHIQRTNTMVVLKTVAERSVVDVP